MEKIFSLEEVEEALTQLVEEGKLKVIVHNDEKCYAQPDYLPGTDYSKCNN